MRSIHEQYPDVHYYELPVISQNYASVRWVIDGGMRAGIEDQTARKTTITLYIDTDGFRESLALPTSDNVYVLLLDKDGYVRWRAEGSSTSVNAQALQNAIRELLSQS